MEPTPLLVRTGFALLAVCLVIVVIFIAALAFKQGLFSAAPTGESIIYIDAPGRLAIDKIVQAEGPSPVYVAAGEHTITFFDIAPIPAPLKVTVTAGQFLYVPDPRTNRATVYAPARGSLQASAFPPDTTIEIPNCDTSYYRTQQYCQSRHTLSASLRPGPYLIHFRHPLFDVYTREITISADSHSDVTHSFISTIDEWNAWSRQHGNTLSGGRYNRRYSNDAEDVILFPVRVFGEVVDELL